MVAEGGINTMQTVAGAVKKQIPAVIVKDSGRVADIIAMAYQGSTPEPLTISDTNGVSSTMYMIMRLSYLNMHEETPFD